VWEGGYLMLKKLSSRKLVFFVLLSLFSILVMVSSTIAKAKRGEEPRCQGGVPGDTLRENEASVGGVFEDRQ